ncbi:MAG: hypothetical protein KKD63_11400 [Proteobacteria bacterium]|nr:hypothetical protein [Pseudomonadota bacterium]
MAGFTQSYDLVTPLDNCATVTIAAGDNKTDVDFGYWQPITIGNYVWMDTNNNGIQDDGNTGKDGVLIKLLDCTGDFVASTITDNGGKYSFIVPIGGQYQVQFLLPAGFTFSKANEGNDDVLDSDANQITGIVPCATYMVNNDTIDAGLVAIVPSIDIRKQAEGPDSRTVINGSDVSFEIVVTNTGNAPLTNVEVTDTLVPACAKTIGDLAPGISTSYTCTTGNVTANFTNIAMVNGIHNGMNYTDSDESTVMVDTPSIEVNKLVSVDGGMTWLEANDINDCADAPQAGSCDGTSGSSCGPCDGKVSDLSLLYHGTKAAIVKITNRNGFTLYTQTVQPEGIIVLSLADSDGKLTPSIKIYVDGLLYTSLHTSCSQPIGPGLIVGNFEVVSGSSLNGGQLCSVSCAGTDPAPTCGTCNGKVSQLTLGYTGNSNAKVKIVNKDGYTLLLKDIVTPGEMLNFSLANGYGNLTTDIKIYLNGYYHTSIHTSCSQPIGPGLVFGNFQVISGASLNGGILCPYDGIVSTSDSKSCDGKITELEMVYNGNYEKSVLVKDKDGRELFKGSVKPGKSFKFSGKDNYGTCTSDVTVYVESRFHGTIKTDCSQDIGSGYKVGDFKVSTGKSSHGGKLSKISSNDYLYQNGQETCTYLPTAPPCTPDKVSYKFVVTNTGNTSLSNVTLSDTDHQACSVSSVLAAGEIDECIIGPFDSTPGLHTNTATATGDYITGAMAVTVSDTDNASYCGGINQLNPAIDIRKQAEGPDSRTVISGSDVSFEIVVTNTGTAPLTNVAVTDAQIPACAKTIGDLAPGISTSYTCIATNITANLTNIATVTGTYNSMNYTDSDESTVMVDSPSIEINKYVSLNGGSTWLDANGITDCADAPQINACDGTTGTNCAPCDGKVSNLTLLYNGIQAAAVKITNKDGYTLFNQTVQPNGQISLALADGSGRLTPSIKLYVNGLFHTSIHTSCSVPIGPGLIAGNFTVVSGSSLNGGQLCAISYGGANPAPTCGTCNGKVSELTLGYTGSTAKVKIVNKDGYTLFEKSAITSGEMLTFSLANNYNNLTTEIKIYLNGSYHTLIHTSCSQPIGPGLVAGKFQVMSGTSLNGGILCAYDGNSITRDDKPCDGKITELEMVYRGRYEKTVQVKDKDGRELYKGSVKPEGKFKFSGKDSSDTCTSEISVYVDSRLNGTVKTDCSVDVGSGYKVGDFQVNFGKSSHGGKLSKVNSSDFSYQNGQESCTTVPPPPSCVPGQVSYKFVVTNTGNTALSQVLITDSTHPACTISNVLAAGEFDDCTIGPFNAKIGLQTNTATTTGKYINGATTVTVSDTDDASYCGGSTPAPINCGLSITKTVDKSTVTKAVFGDGSCFGDDGYDKDGYDKDGYDWDGYDRKGFGHDGYDEDGYNKDGFDRYDRCREGHSKSEHERYGHNPEGYDKDGYNRNGHNSSGYDRHGYDHQGYDKDGSDRKGYDRDGYDKSGFDRSGHCREGHSKDVHQQSGLNRYGYDLDGYNAEGRDKEGYDRQGCNQNGYDRNGYDKNGWNKDGRDRSGHSRTDHDGSGCSPSTDICPSDNLVTYTYTVNNTGNAVQSVMVTDDKLGYIGTINTLATNGTSVLKKSACIKDTTTNTATATVKSWQECSVSAQATVQAVCTDTGSNTCNWWDKTCYDKDGYNHDGYDRDSYDWDGYKSDYQRDRDGYDREGKDKNGYDRSGNYCGSSYYSYGGHSD